MKSKNEKTKLEGNLKNPSRRDAILATGAGVVAAVGATGASSESKTKESSSNKHGPSVEESTSLITGGAREIGLAIALALTKEGANIVLYDVAENLPGVNYPLATENNLYEAQEKIKEQSRRTNQLIKQEELFLDKTTSHQDKITKMQDCYPRGVKNNPRR